MRCRIALLIKGFANMLQLLHGNCLEVLREMPANSVDSVVTDPPYGLSFMGRKWDYDVPRVEIWEECLRVLKPGGHLLAFAGTRTQHRMAVRIEDAGFEIRDMIAWVYGNGFPKSLDVSKAIDKAAGAERPVIAKGHRKNDRDANSLRMGRVSDDFDITAPATEAAHQWQGWGTALKPALEPITVARKPLVGTVAANVLEYGTGALNIDGCRVPMNGEVVTCVQGQSERQQAGEQFTGRDQRDKTPFQSHDLGRWPANLIHDGSGEVLALFPDSKGQQGDVRGTEPSSKTANTFGEYAGRTPSEPRGDTGSAARFFYCAKASKKDRGADNTHPTVKPTDLMAYLCRLVTPPGGVVLDPFMGSGSTGKAARREGFHFIGIEREAEYLAIARARIAAIHACNFPALPTIESRRLPGGQLPPLPL